VTPTTPHPAVPARLPRAFPESARRWFRIKRRDIAFLRFVIEACDGIAFLTTADAARGLVVVHVPPGCEREVEELIEGLRGAMRMEAAGAADDAHCDPSLPGINGIL
jgi:hypothetical protein